jgi:phage tail-like protein
MPASAPPGRNVLGRPEILPANRFYVEIGKQVQGTFLDLSGLTATTETMKVKEGGNNSWVTQLPIRTTFSNVTLKRGFDLTSEFWDWYKASISGKVERRSISIILYTTEHPSTPRKRWNVFGAYPVKWTGPTFNAKSNEFATESLELAYDYFTLGS